MSDIDILLKKGVEEIIVSSNLERELKAGKKLRVKLGIDPTTPELHLGHLVPLLKLKQFQEAGHKAVLIIGDFTATIGDPSGRSETRKHLTEPEVKKNFRTYLKQAEKVINVKKVEVHYNSEWYKRGGLKLLLEIIPKITVQQVLKREDFDKRIKEGNDLSILEMLYPILQGYDSVAVKSDLEIGGTDQKFNLLMGRRLQRVFGKKEQDVMTLPLLLGTDGARKMSKSFGNHIALMDKPTDIYGKVMSIPDSMIKNYIDVFIPAGIPESIGPYESKQLISSQVVKMIYGEKEAEKAKDHFHRVFSLKEIPEDMPTIGIKGDEISALDLLLLSGVKSKTEARRLISQNAADIDGKSISDKDRIIISSEPMILKIGKKRFFRVARI